MTGRQAWGVVDADRDTVRYRSSRDDDAVLRVTLRESDKLQRRFAYPRLLILLAREWIMINGKTNSDFIAREGVAVRSNRRPGLGKRASSLVLALPNQR